MMIEERRSSLERVRHRHDVHLDEQICRQVESCVDGQHRVHRIERADASEQVFDHSDASDGRVVGPAAELALELWAEHAHPRAIAVGARSVRGADEPRHSRAPTLAIGWQRYLFERAANDRTQRRRDALPSFGQPVPPVAGERLIAAIAVQRDGDMLARQP